MRSVIALAVACAALVLLPLCPAYTQVLYEATAPDGTKLRGELNQGLVSLPFGSQVRFYLDARCHRCSARVTELWVNGEDQSDRGLVLPTVLKSGHQFRTVFMKIEVRRPPAVSTGHFDGELETVSRSSININAARHPESTATGSRTDHRAVEPARRTEPKPLTPANALPRAPGAWLGRFLPAKRE